MSHIPTSTTHLTQLNLRSLDGSAKYFYHRWRASEEAVDTEVRAVLAGERVGIKALERLRRQRDKAWSDLLPFMQEIARRVRQHDGLLPDQDDDARVDQYFIEKRKRLEQAASARSEY